METSSGTPAIHRQDQRDIYIALILAVITIFAGLATNPFLEMGLSDDCSYYRTAQVLAQTGHFVYNGWATAMLGAQVYYGALIVKLFGFSFTGLRLAMLPFAAGCSALIYALGRRSGLPRLSAVFLTLAATLSPVFVPLSVSYMTDVFGYFFLLLATYAAVRATEAEQKRSALIWLVLTALAGATGATARQPIALIPLIAVPFVLWRRRKQDEKAWATLRSTGIGLWAFVLISAVISDHWFAAQPYVIHGNLRVALVALIRALPRRRFLYSLVKGALTPCVLLLPVTLCTLPLVWKRRVWDRGARAIALLPLGIVLILALVLTRYHGTWWPYWEDLFSWRDFWLIDYNGDLDDTLVTILPRAIRGLLLLASVGTLMLAALLRLRSLPPVSSMPSRLEKWARETPPALPILSAYVAIYLPAILVWSRMPGGVLLDRYWMPLLPLFGLLALRAYHQTFGDSVRIPVGAWAVLACYGFYSVASTHDHLAIDRGRLQAADILTRAGVPRVEQCVNFPYDAWTQIVVGGYLNEHRLAGPPGAYKSYHPAVEDLGLDWYAERTPALRSHWFVLLHPSDDLDDPKYPPIHVPTWLPPYGRTVYIQQLPHDFGAPERATNQPSEQETEEWNDED